MRAYDWRSRGGVETAMVFERIEARARVRCQHGLENTMIKEVAKSQIAEASSTPLTLWLRAAGSGDRAANDRVYTAVFGELHRIAASQLAHAEQTLTPTVLVSEAYLKLANGALLDLNDRQHFFNLAARAMRQIVISHARERLALKRGGDLLRTEFDDGADEVICDSQQTLALDQALRSLEKQDRALAEIWNWRVFAGLSTPEIAQLRGVTERTVQRELAMARSYLRLLLQ
jgi:RNA polymerase sigma factor (TIGR02999 family)